MAFVLEDGTGVATANSYVSKTWADAYFLDRGVTAWTGTDAVKEAALINASEYVDLRFGAYFAGVREFPDTPQAMEFPRLIGEVTTGIPEKLRRAVCEYAKTSLTESLTINPQYDESGRQGSNKTEKVGPITEEYTYARTGAASTPVQFKPYPIPDSMIRSLLKSRMGVFR